jgi:hypothetical protein
LSRDGAAVAKKNDLKPWTKEYWCLPPEANAEFVCAMENVLEAYHRALDPEQPLVCLDEQPVQLVDDVRPPVAAEPATADQPGTLQRLDYEYERLGTASIFMMVAPLLAWRHVAVSEHRRREDFAAQLKWLVDEPFRDARRVRIVCDNLNTHNGASLYEAYPPEEARRILQRIEFVHTPKHGSWLNIAECELSVLTRQCLDRRFDGVDMLRREVIAWENKRNAEANTVDWHFTTADARIKLKRLYPKFQN